MGNEAYVGIKPCGCAVAATMIDPEHAKETRKDVMDYLRRGLKVECWPIERVRSELRRCVHVSRPTDQTEMAL